MDLNPDEAIVAGWLKESSLVARILNGISLYSLRRANAVIVLDRFMRDRVLAKGISRDKVVVVPPWSHDDAIWFDAEGRDRFRAANGLKEKFVVMYSGNHSPCHPLDTLLEAAKCLARDSRIAFCFVGGGSEHQKVKRFAEQNKLQNVVCMPYQPLARLRGSLSAADLHVVVMGNKFVGTIHPCKIYNILSINSPFLYIGPSASHVSDLMADLDNGAYYGHAEHGDVEGIIKAISVIMHKQERGKAESYARVASCFSQERLLPRLVAVAEGRDVEAQQGF